MESTINKEYFEKGLADRMHELRDRYYMYCRGIDEFGRELTRNSASNGRSYTKRDIDICNLVYELLGHIDHDFMLSEEASLGYEKLCEPNERHRSNTRYIR